MAEKGSESPLRRLLKAFGIDKIVDYKSHAITVKRLREWQETEAAKPVAALDAVQLTEPLRKFVGEVLDSGKAGVIREDLVEYLVSLIIRTRSDEELVRLFSGFLTEAHMRLLKISMAASNLRQLGDDNASMELVRSAEREYGPDARKIHNLYSAGYIQNYAVYWLAMIRFEFQTNPERMFREWFSEKLKFFELAIFVNQLTTAKDLLLEIRKRLAGAKPKPEVAVWAAGQDNIQLTDQALKEWIDQNPNFDYEVDLKRYGKAPGLQASIYSKKKYPKRKSSRLEPGWWKIV